MSKLKKESVNNEEDLFKELLAENDFFKESIAIESFVAKLLKKEETKLLSLEAFYFELINTKDKNGLHPDFNYSLYSINSKELYNFFNEEKIRKFFYSDTEESVMFLNKMVKNIKENFAEFSDELISCVNLVIKIQDDDNKKMIDFKAKLYLNILSQLTYNKNVGSLLLEKINTDEKEMIKFLCKHLNEEIEFDDFNGRYNTIKSRIYYNYYPLSSSRKINENGNLLKYECDERAINIGKKIARKKEFKDFLMKKINDLTFIGSTYASCLSKIFSFVDIVDITTLNKLKEVLNENNVHDVVNDECYLEKYPTFGVLLKDMDMKIIKEEQKYLNSVVETGIKKKVNNRL